MKKKLIHGITLVLIPIATTTSCGFVGFMLQKMQLIEPYEPTVILYFLIPGIFISMGLAGSRSAFFRTAALFVLGFGAAASVVTIFVAMVFSAGTPFVLSLIYIFAFGYAFTHLFVSED